MSVQDVHISLGTRELGGNLFLPPHPLGLIIFVHGSGSSRFSPRNIYVAESLAACGLAALLFDLLLIEETQDRRNVFNIELLAERLNHAIFWAMDHPKLQHLPIGLFGASTGAAAAIMAAAQGKQSVFAIVSRGGRPDLAASALTNLKSPILLIVGGADHEVLQLNQWAFGKINCEASLEIISGATHLFEETGTLEKVAEIAGLWFVQHLPDPKKHSRK